MDGVGGHIAPALTLQIPVTNPAPIPAQPIPVAQGPGLTIPPTAPPSAGNAGRSLRKRPPAPPPLPPSPDRTTRSGTHFANRPRWMPKLKLKVSESSDGRNQSFLGPYDRDLDSEEEDLVFEEQFILRMPPGKDCERIREVASKRGNSSDVWFKFKDARRAVFHVGDTLHPAKLVDLPCIIESQKTLDNKHMFKVSDICQMLVVEDTTAQAEDSGHVKKAFNASEFIWPHGITPPLQHVRKRRFRKRLNRQAIENVENEVDRLLSEDRISAHVEEFLFENEDPNASDSEFIAKVMPPQTPDMEGSDGGENEGGKEENDDDAFAAAIELALQGPADSEEEEEDDEEEGDSGQDDEGDDDSGSESGSGSESDEDEDDEEYSGAKKLLDDEIKQLENAIAKKNADIAKVTNNALKNRFITAVAKMNMDLEGKVAQREQLLAEHRAQKEREAQEEAGEESDEEEDVGVPGGADVFFGEPMDMS